MAATISTPPAAVNRPLRIEMTSIGFAPMSPTPRVDSVRTFEPADLGAATRLLADRHHRHRLAEPLLDAAYEDPSAARREIEELLAGDRADGWVAVRDGEVAGYIIGISKPEASWGPNVWVEAAGHSAADAAVVRALYAAASAAWVEAGRLNHHVLVPASDAELVDAWFGLDFGTQHLHAVREVPAATFGVVPRAELVIRRPTRADIFAMAELELVLPEHLRGAPVFSRLPIETIEEVEAAIVEDFDDPSYTWFIAEHDGRVVGDAIGCSLEKSGGATSLNRPAHAAFLAYVAVFPDARGLGVGRALGETVLAWARDAGYASIATDWRSANLEADRSWRALGFRPTFRRMHRIIG
jgi:GNAT superfamily N-acetyltransferase